MNTKLLRLKILDLAFRGKLVPQDTKEEAASELLVKIWAEKDRLIRTGDIRRDKKDCRIFRGEDDAYYELCNDGTTRCIEDELPYDLPDGWAWARINGVCIVNPRNDVEDDVIASFVPMTLIDDEFSNHFTFQERPWREIKSGFTHFQEGDVGLAKITPCLENRKSAVFTGLTNAIGAGTTELHIFRPIISSLILPEYLQWYFKTERFINDCIGAFTGAVGQQRVGKDYVSSYLLPVPPASEQSRIVHAIERAFNQILSIESDKSYLQASVTAAKAKILSLAIRGKLVSQCPADERASALVERIHIERDTLIRAKRIRRDRIDSIITRSESNSYYENTNGKSVCINEQIPFELPEGWVWARLGSVAFYKKGPFGSSITKAMFIPESETAIKVYEQQNAINKNITLGSYYISSDKFEELKGFEVYPEDIIVSCAGTIGETYVMPTNMRKGIINQALMRISLYDKRMTDFYLLYFDFVLKSDAQDQAKGTAIKNIPPFDVLKQYLIPIPPLAEQQRIVNAMKAAFRQLDNILANLN